MSRITLSDMRFYAHHGCFAEEQCIGTHFRVDLAYWTDTAEAEQSDDIAHTVSYLDVYQVVKREMGIPSHLLEHVARRIANALLRQFEAIGRVEVRLAKLAPPLGGQVGEAAIEITADRPR